MELRREPYQTELDELVDMEIAAVLKKNEERKKRKGLDGPAGVNNVVNDDVDERLLFLEDAVEKIDVKMDSWGNMLSKLYEKQFGKTPTLVEKKRKKQTPVSQKMESGGDSDSSEKSENEEGSQHEKSENEEGSEQSSHDDDSSDGGTLDDDEDKSAGKKLEVPPVSGKLKEKVEQENQGEADVQGIRTAGENAMTGAGPSDRGRASVSSSDKIPKVSSLFLYLCPVA